MSGFNREGLLSVAKAAYEGYSDSGVETLGWHDLDYLEQERWCRAMSASIGAQEEQLASDDEPGLQPEDITGEKLYKARAVHRGWTNADGSEIPVWDQADSQVHDEWNGMARAFREACFAELHC
jgi:hypothetical protein